MDSPRNINDCLIVDLVKESIEDNSLREVPIIIYEAFFVHFFDVEANKALGDVN
ncbi:hypothetical protein PanWU01x14_118120, partial [Parasponia andersonii]